MIFDRNPLRNSIRKLYSGSNTPKTCGRNSGKFQKKSVRIQESSRFSKKSSGNKYEIELKKKIPGNPSKIFGSNYRRNPKRSTQNLGTFSDRDSGKRSGYYEYNSVPPRLKNLRKNKLIFKNPQDSQKRFPETSAK